MVQRTEPPVDRRLERVVAQGDPHRLDLVGLAEPSAGPLDHQPWAEGVGELVDQDLDQDVDVRAIGAQGGGGQLEVEVVRAGHSSNPTARSGPEVRRG